MNPTVQLIHLTVKFERQAAEQQAQLARQEDDLVAEKPMRSAKLNILKTAKPTLSQSACQCA